MATHSSILVCRIRWMEEPGGLQSTGSQRVRHDCATSKKKKKRSVFLADQGQKQVSRALFSRAGSPCGSPLSPPEWFSLLPLQLLWLPWRCWTLSTPGQINSTAVAELTASMAILLRLKPFKKGSSLFLDVMSWNDALNPLSLVLRVFVVFFFP